MHKDDDKKIIVLFPTKTGSTSIRKTIKGSNSYHYLSNDMIHLHYKPLDNFYKKGYTFHCFYRNPYERLISAIFHIKNKMQSSLIKITQKTEISDLINQFDQIFNSSQLHLIVAPQSMWIQNHFILYNFHNFDKELHKLMLNIGATDYEIFHENKNIQEISDLSDLDKTKLREISHQYYKDDYNLFKSLGICFDK